MPPAFPSRRLSARYRQGQDCHMRRSHQIVDHPVSRRRSEIFGMRRRPSVSIPRPKASKARAPRSTAAPGSPMATLVAMISPWSTSSTSALATLYSTTCPLANRKRRAVRGAKFSWPAISAGIWQNVAPVSTMASASTKAVPARFENRTRLEKVGIGSLSFTPPRISHLAATEEWWQAGF